MLIIYMLGTLLSIIIQTKDVIKLSRYSLITISLPSIFRHSSKKAIQF